MSQKLQQMKKLIGTKVKFITDYMPAGEYDVMSLDKIEIEDGEFKAPYFTNKDNDRFCTLEYAMSHKID